jgi:hypothetical protein
MVLDRHVDPVAGRELPGGSAWCTDLDAYVPSLFVFAATLLASMTVAREAAARCQRRLQLSTNTRRGLPGRHQRDAAAGHGGYCHVDHRGEMAVGGFAQMVPRAFVIANLPLGVLMFLSGGCSRCRWRAC